MFIILHMHGGSNFESVGEILKCDHLNESYWAFLSFSVQVGSNFGLLEWNPLVWTLKWRLLGISITQLVD